VYVFRACTCLVCVSVFGLCGSTTQGNTCQGQAFPSRPTWSSWCTMSPYVPCAYCNGCSSALRSQPALIVRCACSPLSTFCKVFCKVCLYRVSVCLGYASRRRQDRRQEAYACASRHSQPPCLQQPLEPATSHAFVRGHSHKDRCSRNRDKGCCPLTPHWRVWEL